MASSRRPVRRYVVTFLTKVARLCERIPLIARSARFRQFRGKNYLDRMQLDMPPVEAWKHDARELRLAQVRRAASALPSNPRREWPSAIVVYGDSKIRSAWSLGDDNLLWLGCYLERTGPEGNERFELGNVFRRGPTLALVDNAKLVHSLEGRDREYLYEGVHPADGSRAALKVMYFM